MLIYAGGRRSGRTTELIKLAMKENAYILVSDRNRALDIRRLADKLGYPGLLFPITAAEFWRSRNRGYVTKLLLDDADDFLASMAFQQGWDLRAISICKTEESFIDISELQQKGCDVE